jgi:hypothetical protein
MAIDVRTFVRQGDPLVVRVSRKPIDSTLDGSLRYHVAARADATPASDAQRYVVAPEFSREADCVLDWKDWAPADLPPGEHTVHLVVGSQFAFYRSGKAVSERIDQSQNVVVNVLPRGSPLGEAVENPLIGNRVAQALLIRIARQQNERIVAELFSNPVNNVDRAFAVYAMAEGGQWRIGDMCAEAGALPFALPRSFVVPVTGEKAKKLEKLTLIFVADGEALRGTLNQTKYWNGRIEYPDIPVAVESSPPTTRPYRIE